MIEIYARNYGGVLNTVEWLGGQFPLAPLTAKLSDDTALAVVVSPNNPTGGLIPVEQILEVADAVKAVGGKLLVDNAYIEFADSDPTPQLIAHDAVIIVRTFSKAWGLAGLRVGYLVAPNVEYATQIRNASGPFPVSAVSLEIARRSLTDHEMQMTTNVKFVKTIRALLSDSLEQCGAIVIPSQGNFLLAQFPDAIRVWEELATDGVGVGNSRAPRCLRIVCELLVRSCQPTICIWPNRSVEFMVWMLRNRK